MPLSPVPDILPALPELLAACAAMALLMVGVFRGESAARLVSWLAVATLVVIAVVAVSLGTTRQVALNGLFVTDGFALFMKLLVLLGSAVSIVLAMEFNEQAKISR